MRHPYHQDEHVTLYHGDALGVLKALPDESVDCCVTSPPYYGLRDYGVEGQYGLEGSPAEFVETLRGVFREVRRVLAADGTCWINLGDSYSSSGCSRGVGPRMRPRNPNASVGATLQQADSRTRPTSPLPQKNLMGIPWRVAFALQEDGWILRNDIIWEKPNGMPESVTDRLSTKHEHLFLFSKSPRYWFDLDPIREPLAYPADRQANSFARDTKEGAVPGQSSRQHRQGRPGKGGSGNLRPTGRQHLTPDIHGGRNPGDVWSIPTVPFTGAHYAVMAPEVARRAVLAGCKPGGVVLDPFSGSGTTGMVAAECLRRYIGIDLDSTALDLSLATRLQQASLGLEVSS